MQLIWSKINCSINYRQLFLLRSNFLLRTITTSCNEVGHEKGIVLGMYENEIVGNDENELNLTKTSEKISNRTENKIPNLIRATEMTGKLGSLRIFNNVDDNYSTIAVVGLGRRNLEYNQLENLDESREAARIAAAIGTNALVNEGCGSIEIDAMNHPESVAEGSTLANWCFQENKNESARREISSLKMHDTESQDAWIRGCYKAQAQNLARELCEMPANHLTPAAFAQIAVDSLCTCGINVEVRTMDWIQSQNMSALLAVAHSSCEPPLFLEINYCGGNLSDSPILLIGEGITYNSGGLHLQSSHSLMESHGSMAGAAVTVAVMRAAAAFSLPINLSAVIPLCENMTSGRSLKSGDIIKCSNGKSVAVHDTNNIGLLPLADAMIHGQNIHRPKFLINIASLNDGVRRGLGSSAAGVFSNSCILWEEISKSGSITGDRVHRLPLWNCFYEKVRDINEADVSNTGKGNSKACLSAATLKPFITCPYWMHVDVKGVAIENSSNPLPYYKQSHMTGRPTRTLIEFLYRLACNAGLKCPWKS